MHSTDGTVLGEWGVRNWQHSDTTKSPKRTNVHIARQSLRLALLQQLAAHPHLHEALQWGHQLVGLQETPAGIELSFVVDGQTKTVKQI